MRFPHDVFPTKFEYDLYVGGGRVVLFMKETEPLTREAVVACLLKNIDTANNELAILRHEVSRLKIAAANTEGEHPHGTLLH